MRSSPAWAVRKSIAVSVSSTAAAMATNRLPLPSADEMPLTRAEGTITSLK